MSFFMPFFARPAALRALRDAYDILGDLTPLKMNCGKLCGAACCQSDETGENGMLLFPYEEWFYRKPIKDFDFHLVPDDTLFKGGKRLVCQGSCPREHRPLACRLFPLRMRLQTSDEGQHTEIIPEIDPRSWVCCPLPEQGGLRAMRQDFIEAVRKAGQRLIQNDDMLEALYNEQQLMDEMRKF
jgi:Fe-S-cluster containining protein